MHTAVGAWSVTDPTGTDDGYRAATIQNAPPGTGQGTWEFPADSGSTRSLRVVLGGETAPPVSP